MPDSVLDCPYNAAKAVNHLTPSPPIAIVVKKYSRLRWLAQLSFWFRRRPPELGVLALDIVGDHGDDDQQRRRQQENRQNVPPNLIDVKVNDGHDRSSPRRRMRRVGQLHNDHGDGAGQRARQPAQPSGGEGNGRVDHAEECGEDASGQAAEEMPAYHGSGLR